MYQTALDALIYPAEINTISLGNFLDGHAQVKPGIDPLGLLVRQLHHHSIELIAELLVLQDFFRGRWGGGMIYQIPAGTGFEMRRIPHRKMPGAGPAGRRVRCFLVILLIQLFLSLAHRLNNHNGEFPKQPSNDKNYGTNQNRNGEKSYRISRKSANANTDFGNFISH